MKQPINRTQMEAFSRTLEAAKQRKSLPEEQFNSLHIHFHADDGRGVAWTVGIHSRKWHRLEGGKWVQAYPPETLYLDENLLQELQTLGQTQSVPACRQCGASLAPDKKFCTACGARVELQPAERRCPRCNQVIAVGQKFCTADGTPVP
jgi:hypothetical protein